MARRIDIELTSARPDGVWTWRAAGALHPRGVLDGDLLFAGAKAGDVVRADAEFELDGINIVAVLPPKEKKRSDPERIELISPSRPAPGVTTQLVGRSDRRGSGRDGGRRSEHGRGEARAGSAERRDVGPRGQSRREGGRLDRQRSPGRGSRPTADEASPTSDVPSDEEEVAASAAGVGSDTAAPTEPGGEGRRRRGGQRASAEREDRRDGAGRSPGGRQQGQTRRSPGGDRQGGDRQGGDGQEHAAGRSAARRLNPGNTHRQAVLASLPPEHQPIAEQVLRGGIPAVRTAVHLEREKAAAEGRPAPNAEQLLAIAEDLLPRLKTAEWRDRAEAASKAADQISLRDLRSVVAGSDMARDDETRQLAARLREALDARLAILRAEWAAEIDHQLDDNRVVRALRLAARPPEVSARMASEQAERLTAAASAAMAPETAPDRWMALLEAVAASPVRRQVVPVGLPADTGPNLVRAAQQQVGRVPALTGLLGISMPPPPGPVRGGPHRPAPPRPSAAPGPDPDPEPQSQQENETLEHEPEAKPEDESKSQVDDQTETQGAAVANGVAPSETSENGRRADETEEASPGT